MIATDITEERIIIRFLPFFSNMPINIVISARSRIVHGLAPRPIDQS